MIKNFTYIIITLFIIQTLGNSALGQTTKKIFGYVYNSNSEMPLIGANVIINNSSLGTSTDGFGYFQFDNIFAGSYSVTVSYIGYKSKTISNINVHKDQPTQVNIYLEQGVNKLNEVLITSAKDPKTSANIKLYTQEYIEKNNFQSVGELLQQTPGVEIESTGGIGSSKKISIRGSETNQVLVMLDGIQLNNQFGGDADLSKIPTNIIERIEIYEGGSSSKFGSGAIGGAINIITKKNFKNEYKVNLSTGSFGLINIEPNISGSINNLSYFLSYNILQSNGNYSYNYINTAGNKANTTRINADIKSQNVFARINYNLDRYLFSINAQNLNSTRGIPGRTNALTPYAQLSSNNNTLGASIKSTFNKVVIDITGNYSKTKTENSNLYPDDAPPEYTRYPNYHYMYETNITVINTTLFYKPIEWLDITAGYNGKWLNYNDENFLSPIGSSISSAKDISNGIFLHQVFKIDLPKPFNNFVVTPTLRYDEINLSSNNLHRFENQWSPSASIYLSAGEKNKLYFKSTISRSFRVPTFSDLFYQDVRINGKPDLLPEKSLNKEIGIGWEIKTWGRLKGEINLYKYTIEDMIVWKLGSFEVFHPFNNDAEITGEEYSLEYKFPKPNLSFNISYTHLQPLDKNDNKTTYNKIIPYKPQHSIKSSLQFIKNEFTGILNYRFVGERFVTSANTVELPYYNVVDLSMLQNFYFGKVKTTFKLSINNLINENYEIIRNYPLPGREFRIGLTLTY